MFTVILPTGVNPIAVNKYIISYQMFSINFEEIPARDHRNFEEKNKDCEPIVFIINFCIIINVHYNHNCVINSQCNYYISNKGLLEKCDKEENLDVAGAATTSHLKRKL
jgi:hypothetical protein